MKGPDYSNWLHGNQNHTIKTGRPKLHTKRQKKMQSSQRNIIKM